MRHLARITLTFALALALGAVPASARAGSKDPAGTASYLRPLPKPNPKHKGLVHGAQILIAHGVGKGSKIKRTRAQAERLARKLAKRAQRNPSAFAALARQHSDDAATRAKGGDLGVFTSGYLPSAKLEARLYTLKVGHVSGAVRTKAGYHVLYRKPLPKVIRLGGAHIQIAFKGAKLARPHVTRSKKQALAKARKLLRQLRLTPSAFDRLARQHSDGPSASKGGRLGSWTYGRMVEPFEHALLRIGVGAISGPVLTRFGYHVIRRDPVP